MANCPECGSTDIALKKETNVSWGRAIGGYLLFGMVGGAVGAITGDDRNVNACLTCGTSWKAADLYQSLQLIERIVGRPYDLSVLKDRQNLGAFLKEYAFIVDAYKEDEKKADEVTAKLVKKTSESGPTGCVGGCFFSVMIFFISGGAVLKSPWLGLGLFALPFLLTWAGIETDKYNKKSYEPELQKAEQESARMKRKTQSEFDAKLAKIAQRYY